MPYETSPEREEHRRLLTRPEEDAFRKMTLEMLFHHTGVESPSLGLPHLGLRTRKADVSKIICGWEQHGSKPPFINGWAAGIGETPLENNILSDIFDSESDPEIIDTITAQLARQPYAEFTPAHFAGVQQDRVIFLDSPNPYLDPLQEHTFDSTGNYFYDGTKEDKSSASSYASYFDSRPIYVPGPVQFSLLRAYKLEDQVFVSAYSERGNILTNWRPLESVSLRYSLPRTLLTDREMRESYGRSVNPQQIDFVDEQVALIAESLRKKIKAGHPDAYSLHPPYESRRIGPKLSLFRRIDGSVLESVTSAEGSTIESGYYEGREPSFYHDTYFPNQHVVAIKPEEVEIKDGTVWVQDLEAGLEVPYRHGSRMSPASIHIRDLAHLVDPFQDNRFGIKFNN